MNRRTTLGSLWLALLFSFVGSQAARAQLDADTYNELLDAWLAADAAGRYQEAERYARQIRTNDEQFYPSKFAWRLFLGMSLHGQGRYREAQPLLESYAELCRRHYGAELRTVEGLLTLGAVYLEQGLHKEAQPVLEEAVRMGLQVLGPGNGTTLTAQGNLAFLYHQRGELQRAGKLYREVIDGQHRLGKRDTNRLIPILNLCDVYMRQGRYEHAESMARYGLGVARSVGATSDNPRVILLLHSLGSTYISQNRAHEARPLLESALAAGERALGRDHPHVGRICGDLSNCYLDLGERKKGIAMLERAIEVVSSSLGPEHPTLAVQYYNLGWLFLDEGNRVEAERTLKRALEITQNSVGLHHRQTAEIRILLADVMMGQDKDDEAAAQVEQALTDLAAEGIGEIHRHGALRTQARLAWKRGDKSGAVERLERAIELADASRAFSGGADVERAAAFSQFSYSYELMLDWQAELGNVREALNMLERARARTFLESMNLSGIDLLEGRTPAERAQSQERQAELRGQASKLESELNELPPPADQEDPAIGQRRRSLVQAVTDSRDALYRFERDLRSSSPSYRKLISTQPKLPGLAEVQKQLVPERSLLISYFLGTSHSYVLAARPTDAHLIELTLTEDDASQLGLTAGPLTRDALQQTLIGDAHTGVLARLARPEMTDETLLKLHALWRAVMPAALREEITSDRLERLVILPDGPLALLPMEALVVEKSPSLTYLLDAAPPIQYAPSAAVLMSLVRRPAVPPLHEPVLTLGDPRYGRPPTTAVQADLLAQAATSSRSTSIRQRLSPLPHSGTESRWVADVFRNAGAESVQLLGANATEAQVRSHIAGRELVHLACHGMSDDAYGNFFGMLAVAPGSQAGNPQDDGMLTLAEIYGLDLRGCELSILSACMTNHGPEQRGEGIWALSRGFLVAGSRRVIASNWVVDDEAGASLVYVCCSRLADARKARVTPDYARALWDAKRWVRRQEKWQSPYYWAPFVLVGPN